MNDNSNENIYDVNAKNFQEKVMQQSMKTPVMIDFWADWCQPCKKLMPVLEQIVNSYKGKIKLAKINIDENKQMAEQMQIRSVPTVAIVYKGQPIDGFSGNIAKSEIEEKIKKIVLNEANDDDEQSEKINVLLELSEQEFKKGNYDKAMPLFMEVLAIEPEQTVATAGLAKCYINMNDIKTAQEILENSNHQDDSNIKEALKILDLAKQSSGMGDKKKLKDKYEKNKKNIQAGFDYAIALFGLGKQEQSIDLLLELFKQDKDWKDGAIKDKLLEFFAVLGFENSIAIEGRKKLSTLMFI
ncbi:MAG: thioredoxin [Alphaproteobacteria bacterium]|nr:thioredoxin [Alphaproteobacteria bacterium]